MSSPFTEKYRPLKLSDVYGNTEVIKSLSLMKNSLPHMLFYGPPGCGKTTTIRALANELYKNPALNVLELNASNERGIQVVRETIKEFVATSFGGKKLVILDEADSMSRDAQNALRRIIEDFSRNVRFCLIANYSNRLIPAIQSRLCKFRFGPIKEARRRIEEIIEKEGIKIEEDAIKLLEENMNGDMRKLMNDIDALKSTYKNITRKNVNEFARNTEDDVINEFYREMESKCVKFDDLVEKAIKIGILVDSETFLRKIGEIVVKSDQKNKMKILKKLSDIEYNITLGCSQRIQIMAMVGIFYTNML